MDQKDGFLETLWGNPEDVMIFLAIEIGVPIADTRIAHVFNGINHFEDREATAMCKNVTIAGMERR